MPELWVKREDFQDEYGNIPHKIKDYGTQYFLKYLFHYIFTLSNQEGRDLKEKTHILELKLKQAMGGIQQAYEERIFSRLPPLTEKYMIAGQKLQFYITPNGPKDAPIMVIHPELWAKVWRPLLQTPYWLYVINEGANNIDEVRKNAEAP